MPTDAQQTRAEAFRRRCSYAENGRHLPTVNKLLRLSPFFQGDIDEDIVEFAERTLRQVRGKSARAVKLREALKALTVTPVPEFVEQALHAFYQADATALHPKTAKVCIERFHIYAAGLGSVDHALKVAQFAFARAARTRDKLLIVDYLRSTLGWLSFAHFQRDSIVTGPPSYGFRRSEVIRNGGLLIEAIADYFLARKETAEAGRVPAPVALENMGPAPSETPAEHPPGTLIVVSSLGGLGQDKREIEKQFTDILNCPLPLLKCENISAARHTLMSEFPHAASVIDRLMLDLANQQYTQIRPTVLVGNPGTGKTHFCQRFFELVGLPYATYSCGGVSDASFAGNSRHWRSAQPCFPLSLISQHKVANPGLVMDEIEKAGTSRHVGHLHDGLLALLEPESAKNWVDHYLQSPVNLTAVVWLATANSLEDCSAPLRDRLRAIHFPEPSIVHLEALAQALMSTIARERGLDLRWMMPLKGAEFDALRAVWPGGSVRQLRRYLEGVLAVRETGVSKH